MRLKVISKDISSYFTLLVVVCISSLILWVPFLLRVHNLFGLRIENSDFSYIYGNFDGPLYIISAKTFYNPKMIDIPSKGLIISLPLTAQYFAAHLPLYPIFIRLFALFVGYLRSLVFVNLIATILLTLFFFYLVKSFELTKRPLTLVIIFLFLPRFLVVRSVGAPESLFILLILTSLFFFEKQRYFLSGLLGGLAAMTKAPGILLFVAYFLVFFERYWKTKKLDISWTGIFLIPLGLIGVFLIYLRQYGDFFAFFHTGGVVPLAFPYSMFNFQAKWVGTAWLEDVIFYFFLYFLTVIQLKDSKYRSFFYFSLVFLGATLFVQHHDISRYSLPLWPLACIALAHFFTSKKFLLISLLLLPAIYLYAWNFLVSNAMPIGDWKPFM